MGMPLVIAAFVIIFYNCVVNYGWTSGYDQTVEYIYHIQDDLTWNEARNVCLSNGGDLAKLDSPEVLNTLSRLSQEKYGENLLSEHVWIGLVDRTPTRREWVIDCSELNFTSNFPDAHNPSELCFKIKSGGAMTGDNKPCSDTHRFLCERRTVGSCNFKDVFREVAAFDVNGIMIYQVCENYCALDHDCTGVLYVSPFMCFKLGNDSMNQTDQFATVTTKDCGVEFIKNETLAVVFPNEDDFPTEKCSVLPEELMVAPSFSSLIASSTSVPYLTTTPLCSTQVLTSVSTMLVTSTVLASCMSTSTLIFASSCLPVTCSMKSTGNLTANELQEAHDIAEKISKNLTVDAKKTSSHLRSLVSVSDHRATSVTVGTIGVACILVPVALVVLADIRRFYVDIRGVKDTTKIVPGKQQQGNKGNAT